MRPFKDPPVVVGHRGAPRAAPENTPVSFAAAFDAGATWVELDARRSADGPLVVHHDARLPDGRALVECRADELAAAGVWTLDAVLEALPDGLGVDIEVKNLPGEPDYDEGEGAARLVVEALRGRLAERPWMTSSFNPVTVAELAAALPEVPAGLVHWHSLALATAREIAAEHGAEVLCPEAGAPGLDAEGVAEAHEAGLAVMVWTIDDLGEAERLVADHVDAICTNEPGSLAAGLRHHGQGAGD